MGIEIGSVTIPYYGLCIVLGILSGGAAGYIQCRIFRLDFNDFVTLVGGAGIGAVAGAKLLYIIVSIQHIDILRIMEREYLNSLMSGGFVFYGGLAGGFAGVFVCGKIFHIDTPRYVATGIPLIPLAHGFGRIGCLLVGCCYGIPYSGPGAVVYEHSPVAPNGTELFPVQGAEAILDFCISTVLFLYIYKKHGEKLESVEIYLIMYATVRFLLEYLRYDDAERGILAGLSVSQWISILIIMMVTGWMYRKRFVQDV